MHRLTAKINVLLAVALAFLLSGCSHSMNFNKNTSKGAKPPVAEDPPASEMMELHAVIRQNSDAKEVKNAHLKLARLYVSYDNIDRNYQKALEHMQTYASLQDPAPDEETRNWIEALKEIDRLSREYATRNGQITQLQKDLEQSHKEALALKRTNRKLTQEEINLRDKNRKLEESIQKLEQTIEMLKRLDRRLEEKRRNFQ
jgi:DNA repair exonuclease SbcCD ATPase subunit